MHTPSIPSLWNNRKGLPRKGVPSRTASKHNAGDPRCIQTSLDTYQNSLFLHCQPNIEKYHPHKNDTNENLGICFGFRFRNGRSSNFPRFSFIFAFVTTMLGKHKPQQQATLTKKNQIPEIFFRFRFRNPKERKSRILAFLFFSLVIIPVRMV